MVRLAAHEASSGAARNGDATAESTEAGDVFRRWFAFNGLRGGFLPPRRVAGASLAADAGALRG
jgi:hypothetical protein